MIPLKRLPADLVCENSPRRFCGEVRIEIAAKFGVDGAFIQDPLLVPFDVGMYAPPALGGDRQRLVAHVVEFVQADGTYYLRDGGDYLSPDRVAVRRLVEL